MILDFEFVKEKFLKKEIILIDFENYAYKLSPHYLFIHNPIKLTMKIVPIFDYNFNDSRHHIYYYEFQRFFSDFKKRVCWVCLKEYKGRGNSHFCCKEHRSIFGEFFDYFNLYYKRFLLMKKQNERCKICNSKLDYYNDLELHHIIPISKNGLVYADSNLILICKKCHRLIHAKIKKPEPKPECECESNLGFKLTKLSDFLEK